jgi:crotonobetainyl-CoA:carnitine CoA-transferase CaiB-like acyl-CoA transferase
MTAPLAGVLVADFSTHLPGPLATLMLAETGAEVIKIERPGGDEARTFQPYFGGHSAPFALLNRGKKSLVADLKTEAGKQAAWDVVGRADVLVEQFRPGVMDRLGFGYEAARAKNPRIIYCSITGYGQSGPRSQEAGHDLNYVGAAGLLALSPGPADRPTLPPALIADIGGGTFPAVANILLALIARETTGRGARLDIAMTDGLFAFAWYALATLHATGRAPGPGESRHNGGTPRYQLHTTSDGKIVACSPLEQHFWEKFCAAIGLAREFADDKRDPQATTAAVRQIIADKPAAHWKPVFAAADCCVSVIVNLEEALADPHFSARGLFERRVAAPDGNEIPALPVPIAPEFRVEEKVRPFPPLRGKSKS